MPTLKHRTETVSIDETNDGMRQIRVVSSDPHRFIPISSFKTGYPFELIGKILEVKGGDYLCDELAREEDPTYVREDLEFDLGAYFDFNSFDRKRILDFGCGSGASTMILARLFPRSQIAGVELDEDLLSIAKARLAFYRYPNVSLHCSPSGSELPDGIGTFDLVVMSAVYEHLLPKERRTVLPLIWKNINPGGSLFLNMTPHRYFPLEHHTTGLVGINYLPDKLAYSAAKRFSKRVDPSEPWEMFLRRGIRGATETEVSSLLCLDDDVEMLEPSSDRIRDRIDLWYERLNHNRLSLAKKTLRYVLKVFKLSTGIILVPNLTLVFRK
jgi:2-polyprenyl-3-methyl-5-hydroxy-6-metoxy-1,4-benzoquinol methylase